ncbi:hypothetical protein [Thermoanaerobacterium thermosaccharolyticum]|uniref:hypothetical protein n=1 Tax=Thermoanaerobacterium thermosaccharolyticum TaxID=1517 RepID=UPI002FD8F0EA
MDRLKEGHNILIFPEDRNKKYNDVLDKFNTGFINVAKMYFKEYGELISFYPVCVNKNQNRISIGKKIVYDPNISYKIQRENRNYLMENISAMYYNIQYEEDLKKDDYKVCIIYYEVNDV